MGLGGEAAQAGISRGPLDQFIRHTRVPSAIETVGSEAEHSEQEEQRHCDDSGDQQRTETAQAVGKEKEHDAGLREGVSHRPAYRSTRAEPGVRGRGHLLAGIVLCRFVTSVRRSWRSAGVLPARLRIADREPAARCRRWRFRRELFRSCGSTRASHPGSKYSGAAGIDAEPRWRPARFFDQHPDDLEPEDGDDHHRDGRLPAYPRRYQHHFSALSATASHISLA
jgi:hypothetical protein